MSIHAVRAGVAMLALLATQSVYAQTRAMGLQYLDESSYRSIPLAIRPLLGQVPDAVDLAAQFPEPGDQGSQGSCVGWAVAALKGYQEGVERRWNMSHATHRFSPAYIYNQIKRSDDCEGGTLYVDALNLVRRDGAATLDLSPYDEAQCSAKPNDAVVQASRPFAIADWRRVNQLDDLEVKTQVASGFPVLIGMDVDDAFVRLRGDRAYDRFVGPLLGGHAMVVVGYNDQKAAFKVINSWGTSWGSSGFGWISYRAFAQTVREAYVSQDIVPLFPPPVPVPDPSPRPPTPMPQPPILMEPTAMLGMINIVHNVTVPSPTGPQPGMQIFVPAEILHARGQTAQVVLKFNFFNGPPLRANPQEFVFRDVSGLVATGTPATVVGSDRENFGAAPITIPYYALNFQPTGGMSDYRLELIAYVYIGNVGVAESKPVEFGLRW